MPTQSPQPKHESVADSAPSDLTARDHHGSLRSKLVLSLGVMFFIFLTINEIVRRQVIKPEFTALEQSGAVRDANRVMSAIQARVDHLADLASHWAIHIDEDMLPRPGDGSPWEAHSPGDQSNPWKSDSLDWVATLSGDNQWQWLYRQSSATDEIDTQTNTDYSSIISRCARDISPKISGMTRLGDNSLVMFATVALNHGEAISQDQPRRLLVVGRAIDHELVASLRKQTQVDFSLQSMRTQDPHKKLAIWEADESILVVEIQLSGVDHEQLANVYVQVPREITQNYRRTSSMARNSFIFGAVTALLFLLMLLQHIVISPLNRIRKHSDQVAEHGFNTDPLVLSGNDEIGELARAFDNMMRRLSHAQTQLAEASRAAGRSQVASTVIHNVGNVLTNVNSLLDVASERIDGLRIQPLRKLASRLREEDGEGALIDATPDYLENLASTLQDDCDTVSQLMATLHDNVRHIHDVIRDQQRHTGHDLETTVVRLIDVLNEAIGCCRARLEQDSVQVDITGELDADVRTDRSLLLQSAINVIGNARYALQQQQVDSRNLAIRVISEGNKVVVRITDNGIGMDPDTLHRVFDAHFTTRDSGSGLGLHFCANALNRLGGAIHAESDGPGLGSTFVMTLPRHRPASVRNSEAKQPFAVVEPQAYAADYVGAES